MSVRVSYKLSAAEFAVFDKFVQDLNEGQKTLLSHERVAKQSLFRTIEAAYRTQAKLDGESSDSSTSQEVDNAQRSEIQSPADVSDSKSQKVPGT